MNKQSGSVDFGMLFGIGMTIAVVCGIFWFAHRIDVVSEPCFWRNVEERQTMIESHERCMVEVNCIYEDRDIRKYDSRLKQQEVCKLED